MSGRDYFTARPCPCGDKICAAWVINSPELRVTEVQAKIVAAVLNDIEAAPERATFYTALFEEVAT